MKMPVHELTGAYTVLSCWVEALLVAHTPEQVASALEQLRKAHQEQGRRFNAALDQIREPLPDFAAGAERP
jgi:hypothetical protein